MQMAFLGTCTVFAAVLTYHTAEKVFQFILYLLASLYLHFLLSTGITLLANITL